VKVSWPDAERDPGNDRELRGRVPSVQISRAIALGEAELMRRCQGAIETRAALEQRNDVVRGSVQNAANGNWRGSADQIAQRRNNGSASAYSSTEIETRVVFSSERRKPVAMRGDELLVRGNDFRPASERGGGDRPRWLVSPNRFDDYVGIVREKGTEIASEEAWVEWQVAAATRIANENARELEACRETRGDGGRGLVKKSNEPTSNNAAAG
jgi:hypothetical protein